MRRSGPGWRVEMIVVLGLCAAVTYGAADFVGGLVTKRASPFAVVLISQAIGAPAILLLIPIFGGNFSREALAWGALSGLGGGGGVILLYRGLAIGKMSIVAPITAVLAAAIPVVFGLTTGERPSAMSLAGVVAGFLAVYLISRSNDEAGPTAARGVVEALGAGLGFGIFFIALDQAPGGSGMWPLLGARLSALALVGLIVTFTTANLKRQPGTLRAIAAAGGLDVIANVFYLSATRRGLLSLAAVLTSLYPAMTILLARIFLKERLVALQLGGLALGAFAVALISLG
jgi:drug/metabolite transporter (DMT)-like permease